MVLSLAPISAPGDPPSGGFYRSLESGAAPRYHGKIVGRVERVDYADNVIVVRTDSGLQTIIVTPNTQIDARSDVDYETLDDIRPGTLVEIDVSEVQGRLIAQIIRLR